MSHIDKTMSASHNPAPIGVVPRLAWKHVNVYAGEAG
jgi:hypothetical protein